MMSHLVHLSPPPKTCQEQQQRDERDERELDRERERESRASWIRFLLRDLTGPEGGREKRRGVYDGQTDGGTDG